MNAMKIKKGHCKLFWIIGDKGKRKSMVIANNQGITELYGEYPYEITERDAARIVRSA